MDFEEVRLMTRRCCDHNPDPRIVYGRVMPTREQDPYLGEYLRRAKKELGLGLRSRRIKGGEQVSTRMPDAAKVASTCPGFPSNRLWVLQEILEIMTNDTWHMEAAKIEDRMSRPINRRWLVAIAEGREDDVYRELWFGGYNP